MLDLIHKIVSKTIGYDLVGVKPMSDEEFKKWSEENDKKRKEWEDAHPEKVAAQKAWLEKYKSKKSYLPTNEEKEIIKELLNMDDDRFSTMDIYIFNDGDICVRTSPISWKVLAGREWTINLKERKVTLTSMS